MKPHVAFLHIGVLMLAGHTRLMLGMADAIKGLGNDVTIWDREKERLPPR